MKNIYVVEEMFQNFRLDKFLCEVLENTTRSQIKNSIDSNLTLVNGLPAKSGKTLKVGDVVEFEKHEILTDVIPENLPLNIVYEDDSIAVINKPQGMTVHPAVGNFSGTLVNALLYHFDNVSSVGGEVRAGIVHRIDKDTSGLLVVAKTNSAHLSLAKQIAEKTCRRSYLALVEGVVKVNTFGKVDEGVLASKKAFEGASMYENGEWGLISYPIGRSKKDRKQMAVDFAGKPAISRYKIVQEYENYTLLQFDLETGRTHQIRVHSKHIGHPIVGDPVYGIKNQKFNLSGQLLHAFALSFRHPETKKEMRFEVPLPDYFEKTLSRLTKKRV